MTIYHVAVHHTTHTCPGDPHPHVVATHRQVITTIPGGPCHTPVTIRSGDTTATIPCGRHLPTHRQCTACRPIITEATVTTTHTGPATTGQPTASSGPSSRPCSICRQPLAAALADLGRHITCHPHRVAA